MSHESLVDGFKVGEKVWVPLAVGRACGTIVEDRGPLGVDGQRLFRVSIPNDPYSASVFLVNEGEISRLDNEERAELLAQLSPNAIQEFLVNGGLLSILHRSPSGPVWLRRDQFGNLTYTYLEGYSTTGGKQPPVFAVHGERIFEPKMPEVVEFIKSFGLSGQQAAEVVSTIGTAP